MKIAVFCDVFPELSETFVVAEVRALRRAGQDVRVVALRHARLPLFASGLPPALFVEDLTRAEKLRALPHVSPTGALRDVADRRTWRPAEQPRRLAALAPVVAELRAWGAEHVHAHFAAGAAVDALRTARLLGVPASITAHAHEIFMAPRNLPEKIRRAAFVTTGCDYNVRHLRSLVAPADGERIHEIVMGVDPHEFRRKQPHAGGGSVLAVGRLVEKKGFEYLIEAVAQARRVERLTIIGEGPLEARLRARAEELGVQGRVELAGARTPEQVRAALEAAAVLAMPSVVAADGDRDSMPVVVKEAMAMELPVVATREVGLPEIVDDEAGRLVAPRDAAALAAALEELLALAPAERAELGRRGRARVHERANVDTETRKLLALIEAARR